MSIARWLPCTSSRDEIALGNLKLASMSEAVATPERIPTSRPRNSPVHCEHPSGPEVAMNAPNHSSAIATQSLTTSRCLMFSLMTRKPNLQSRN